MMIEKIKNLFKKEHDPLSSDEKLQLIENSSKLRQLRNGTDKTLSAVNCPMSVEMVPVVNATSAKSLR